MARKNQPMPSLDEVGFRVYSENKEDGFDLTINHFTRDLALGRELVVYDQDIWRPYCHVEDISQAIIRVLEYPKKLVDFQVFNLGSNDQNYSKRQIEELVRRVTPKGDVKYKTGGLDRRGYRADLTKIRQVLDFIPSHSAASCARSWQTRSSVASLPT